VAVCSCKNWEKDNKGNETNLGLFRHLLPSKPATHRPPPHGCVSPVGSLANGMFELPSKHCLLHVGKLS